MQLCNEEISDQAMLDFVRDQVRCLANDDPDLVYVFNRVAQLVENAAATKRALQTIDGAHKLALQQLQFAQAAVHQLQRVLESGGPCDA
jgi:hypothetical protein